MRRIFARFALRSLRAAVLVGLLHAVAPVCAQTPVGPKRTAKGIVVNEATRQPVGWATVRLLALPDSSLVAGTQSDSTGHYTLSVPQMGRYAVSAQLVGYQRAELGLDVAATHADTLQLDTLTLAPTDIMLRQAVVTGKVTPMEQVADTFVYNAAAYGVPEGEALEELIRLLPGVIIDDDGKITVNGKEVKELRVNGKDFFKGNKQIALKNLPVELVDKIKAYDKKSDYAEQTGIDDGEEQTVLDVKLKRELNETWISNIDLAYGSKDRFNTRLFANRTTDHSRLTLNTAARNDNARSIDRSAGIDGNFTNNHKQREAGYLELSGHVNVNSGQNHNRSWGNSETFISSGASSSFSNNANYSKNRSHGVSSNLRLQWLPDTLTTIILSPNWSWGSNDGYSDSRSASFNADPYRISADPLSDIFASSVGDSMAAMAVNRNRSNSLSSGHNYSLSMNLMAVRRLNAKGRNVSLDLSGSQSRSQSRSQSLRDIVYFQRNNTTLTNQFRLRPSRSHNWTARISYAEPLAKGFFLQASYRLNHSYNNSDNSLYELDSLDGWREWRPLGLLPARDTLETALNLFNSQYSTTTNNVHRGDLSLRFTNKSLNLSAGTGLEREHTHMDYRKASIDTTLTRSTTRFSPNARLRYRLSRTEQLEMRYNGSQSYPSLTNRLATTDNSDPLNVHIGNAHLKPSWSNRWSMHWNKYIVERQQNWAIDVNANQSNNDISTATLYDETTGGRTTMPRNINGNWSMNGNFIFNTALGAKKAFRIDTNTGYGYRHSVGYMRTQQTLSSQKNVTRNTTLSERLTAQYRPSSALQIEVGGQLNYSHAVNKLRPQSNQDTYNFSYHGSLRLRLPWKTYLRTDLRMSSRRGYEYASANTDQLIWNAEVQQNFFRGSPLLVRLNFYDLLGQRSTVRHNVGATSRSDSYNDNSYSYVMAHVIFRLNIFNGHVAFGHKGGRERRGPDARGGLGGPPRGQGGAGRGGRP